MEDGVVTFRIDEIEVGPPELKWKVGPVDVVPYIEDEDDDGIIWVEIWGEQHVVIPPLEAVGAS